MIADHHYKTLRALLIGRDVPPVARVEGLAQAAIVGGVTRLAHTSCIELSPWLEQAVEERAVADLVLTRAEEILSSDLLRAGLPPAILLKGSASARMIYRTPEDRERRDIDLLVSTEVFEDSIRALEDAGWAREGEAWWMKRSRSRYEVPLVREVGGVRVECDLHRRLLLYRHLPIRPSELFARAAPIPETAYLLPDAHDLFLHTALHAMMTGYQVPLRAWLDLHRLLAEGHVALNVLVGRACDWHSETALWIALRTLSRLWEHTFSPSLMRQLAPSAAFRFGLERLFMGEGASPLTSRVPHEASRVVAKGMVLGSRRPHRWLREHLALRLG